MISVFQPTTVPPDEDRRTRARASDGRVKRRYDLTQFMDLIAYHRERASEEVKQAVDRLVVPKTWERWKAGENRPWPSTVDLLAQTLQLTDREAAELSEAGQGVTDGREQVGDLERRMDAVEISVGKLEHSVDHIEVMVYDLHRASENRKSFLGLIKARLQRYADGYDEDEEAEPPEELGPLLSRPIWQGRRLRYMRALGLVLGMVLVSITAFAAVRYDASGAVSRSNSSQPEPTCASLTFLPDGPCAGELAWESFAAKYSDLLGDSLGPAAPYEQSRECVAFTFYLACRQPDAQAKDGLKGFSLVSLGQIMRQPAPLSAVPVLAEPVSRFISQRLAPRDAAYWLGQPLTQATCSENGCEQVFQHQILQFPGPDAQAVDVTFMPLGRMNRER